MKQYNPSFANKITNNYMDILFLCIIIFLFVLAILDLSVGVSNDAVNFLNSAVGARAASFKKIILVAAIGVFIGAVMSNGMMDIARHGIFRPEHFSFYEVICIFMAVMVTDVILLDIFNSLGMPTSTTVSMVFELLGAAFAVALIKLAAGNDVLGLADLINTEKALSVILGIFLSVAIAFFFGTVVQFISRLIFTFNYKSKLKWNIGIFGGVATTSIFYFLIFKGTKDLTFMTPEIKNFINENTLYIIIGCFVASTILMQILHWCKVNVFKVIVLMGTFALAMAFAGNDLVNFIGVPLTGFSAYQDYVANGSGDAQGFMMSSLNGAANTPIYFLLGAGIIMVYALATSKKARTVINTSVGLSSQKGGEEMFGSSRIARHLVRSSLAAYSYVLRIIPDRTRRWLCKRFDTNQAILEDGAAFDLIRGSVNLTLAGALIAIGTSLKLPLSTTYVTFMVAMGSSLADRAWGRESAVFRITGVISVIGGWFITAGAAFIGAAIIASLLHFGGLIVMAIAAVAAISILIHNNLKYRKKEAEENDDILFQSILSTEDKAETWNLLKIYLAERQSEFLEYGLNAYKTVTNGFINDEVRTLGKSEKELARKKAYLKTIRRKETLCFQRIDKVTAIERNTWFYLANNCLMAILYNLRRINEVCLEHIANNFHHLPNQFVDDFNNIRNRIDVVFSQSINVIRNRDTDDVTELRKQCDEIKDMLRQECHRVYDFLQTGETEKLSVSYVYLNILQESQDMVSNLRKLLRAAHKLNITFLLNARLYSYQSDKKL
jgi:phosphate/sulfate permease